MNTKVHAVWCPARDLVMISLGNWSGSFPGADLARQLAFYRRLRDRRAGRYAGSYTPTIEALEALEKERRAYDA